MNNTKQNALALLAFATALGPGESMMMSGIGMDDAVIYVPQDTPLPNGTKRYWFDASGDFSTEHMRKDDVVFSCIAINYKSAIKKYNKWKQTEYPNHLNNKP
jgi:hypothetical protein